MCIPSPQDDVSLKEKPKVSVIIPCYNSSRYLVETVQSVLKQSLQNLEIVIVDDGSVDNTREVIDQLVVENPGANFHFLSQVNKGVASARNLGICAAQGGYILPLDADDLIESRMLEECSRLLDAENELSVVYTDRLDFGDFERQWSAGKYDLSYLKYFNQMAYCCMYRKSVWAEIGGYRVNVSGFDDWDFWIALAVRGYRARHIAKSLLRHRRHKFSQLWRIIADYERLFAQIILNNIEAYSNEEAHMAKRFLEFGESSRVIRMSKLIFLGRYYEHYRQKDVISMGESVHQK